MGSTDPRNLAIELLRYDMCDLPSKFVEDLWTKIVVAIVDETSVRTRRQTERQTDRHTYDI